MNTHTEKKTTGNVIKSYSYDCFNPSPGSMIINKVQRTGRNKLLSSQIGPSLKFMSCFGESHSKRAILTL